MHRLVAASALVLAFVSIGSAQRIRVPADRPTIQAAIDVAAVGTTIVVAPGVYPERIDFKGKAIRVESAGGPLATTIDGQGGGSVVRFVSNESSMSVLEGFTITGGNATDGGGIYLSGASPRLVSLRVVGNSSAVFGAGLYGTFSASPTVVGCEFLTNTSLAHAGAAAFVGPSSATFVNCVFSRNTAPIGGACYLGGSTIVFTNCTFSANAAQQSGGAIYQAGGRTDIYNSIVWGNQAPLDPQISISGTGGRVVASTSDIDGGWPGTGNLSVDPRFVANAPDDVHLSAQSPCIDAGANGAPNVLNLDVDGGLRIAGTAVDIGADEFAPHAYLAGVARAGSAVRITVVGRVGSTAIWAYSATPGAAIALPGIAGLFQLGAPFHPVPLAPLDQRGVASFSVAFPLALPPTLVFTQTLIASSIRTELTQLSVVDIR